MSEGAEFFRELADRVFQRRCRDYYPIQSALIPILQDVQNEIGYLPMEVLERVSELLKLSTGHVYGVATFYHQFRLTPKGKHAITTCRGTACHVRGSGDIHGFLLHQLRIVPPNDTSDDGLFSVQQVRCIGACSLAPVIVIDDEVYGRVDPVKLPRILLKYRKQKEDKQ